jgi:hypothetical protein
MSYIALAMASVHFDTTTQRQAAAPVERYGPCRATIASAESGARNHFMELSVMSLESRGRGSFILPLHPLGCGG